MTTFMGKTPQIEYQSRLELRLAAAARQEQINRRIAALRLLAFFTAACLAWLSFRSGLLSPWYLALPLAGFILLLVLHERVRKTQRFLARSAHYYERGIARLENRWAGEGEPGNHFADASHYYSDDLDLFGTGSLFERICTARTRSGTETLAAWLKEPASAEDIPLRQAAVMELRERLDLRENLAVLGEDVLAGVNPEALSGWGNATPLLQAAWPRYVAACLSAATGSALILWIALDAAAGFFLLFAVIQGLFAFSVRRKIEVVLEAVEKPGQDLEMLSGVLSLLEREEFTSPRLENLRRMLHESEPPPSRRIARLNRLVVMQKQLFTPIAALLLWDVQMAFAMESWRRKSGASIARWLKVVGEMEALCSLAGYAYERPDDVFPDIEAMGPRFEGEDLGHPILPDDTCVRNDIRLCADRRVLVVSGSNMSGKSTLLRTVGTNAVLALAGAPVRAKRLRISPVSVGASIQRRDSLQAGISRFYAEILRLRQLVEITSGPLPLLFLLDELFHGTNSHDRSIGAEALVKDLVRRNAVGILTTHDLALAHIAELLAPRAENVHFEDHIQDGTLAFDYILRPGIVRKSNALELMRSIGLNV
jgi:hypothetical protein